MASIDSLNALLVEQLRDIYDAEKRLTKAIPKLANLHYSRVSEFLIVEACPSVCDATEVSGSRAEAV